MIDPVTMHFVFMAVKALVCAVAVYLLVGYSLEKARESFRE